MVVVSDASVLLALLRVRRARLLWRLYGEITIPSAVAKEVRTGAALTGHLSDHAALSFLRTVEVPLRGDVEALGLHALHAGEREAIALAHRESEATLLIDEREGRRVARRLGIRSRGTLGVLVDAKREGLVREIAPLVRILREEYDFRLSDRLVAEVLRSVGEG